ncbi:MAG: DUF47 family protein [Planctomycetes bacterium]|nr:DUF47 family protein [Planctomycetota bacterium]
MFSLMPRDTVFFDLFNRAAEIMVRTAETYAAVATDYQHCTEHVARIRQLEHDGDEIAHRVFDRLDQTFITPFDREDIETLMVRMDDVVDEIDAAAKRLTLYRIPEPTQALVKQTEVLLRACRLTSTAVARLRDLKRPNGLQQTLVEIHFLENVGDEQNHAALAALFDEGGDPLMVMKWKEIYELTERAIDRCEDIANVIRGIMLKNA